MLKKSTLIKQLAMEYGFMGCGISKAEFLEREAKPLESWLKKGMNAEMKYMENYFDKRLNPKLLVEGAKSVISFSYNYYPSKKQNPETYQIAKYAYGEDYHKAIKALLKSYCQELTEKIGDFNYRIFVDSAPVLEKAWAIKSGIGWLGKNGNLITKQKGSFYFLAEIICDLDLSHDSPLPEFCGSCQKCIEACPTGAIEKPYVVNGSRCISYATIELKNDVIPAGFKGKMNDWIFGCDICQDVCPWNRFSKPNSFLTNNIKDNYEEMLLLSKKDFQDLTSEKFTQIFKNTPLERTQYKGLKRNIEFVRNS